MKEKVIVGWREWVGLPDFGVKKIKAKVDTGARTSAIHAYDIEIFHRRREEWVRFSIHPLQRNLTKTAQAVAKLIEVRAIRSSNGGLDLRPVISTQIELAGQVWPIELTLTRRDVMGFRMLLGRQAMRGRALVDPGRSFLVSGKPGRARSSTIRIRPSSGY